LQIVLRAVPGADERAVQHPSLVQRAAGVRAARAHSVYAAALTHQRNADVAALDGIPYGHEVRPAFRQVGQPGHLRELTRNGTAVGVIHRGAAAIHQVTAKVAADAHAGIGSRTRPHARAAASLAAQAAGPQVQAQRGRVDRAVHEAHAPVPAVQVLPVREAGGDCRRSPGRAGQQCDVGGLDGVAPAHEARGREQVEAERQRPGADGERYDQRMDGMAVGAAVQGVRQGLRRPAAELPGPGDGLAERIRGTVEAFGGFDPADRGVEAFWQQSSPMGAARSCGQRKARDTVVKAARTILRIGRVRREPTRITGPNIGFAR